MNSNLPVIFLGDYVDPYPNENITWDDTYRELNDIIQFAKMEPDRVTLLLGNHVMHYIGLSSDYARFDFKHAQDIYNIINENKELFQHALKWDNTLFTHAGVTESWLNNSGFTSDPNLIAVELNKDIIFTDKFIKDPNNPRYYELGSLDDSRGWIGCCRGGDHYFGSPNWADIREIYNDSAFKDDLIQIFGHSQLQETGFFLHKDNWYMCDSRAVFIWDGEELKLYET